MDNKKAISLLSITPADEGLGFTVEVPEEFEKWFIKSQNLTEWCDEKFNTWFKGLVGEFLSDEDMLKSMVRTEQQSIDVWGGHSNE